MRHLQICILILIGIHLTGCQGLRHHLGLINSWPVVEGSYQPSAGSGHESGEAIPYCLAQVKESGTANAGLRYPMLVAFHGSGQTGCDYIDLWAEEGQKKKYIVLAPTRVRPYDEINFNTQSYYDLVEDIVRRYPVDSNRIYLAGLSSGSLAVRKMVLDRPALWKGIVFISSPASDEWIKPIAIKDYPPVLFVHGGRDEQSGADAIKKQVIELRDKNLVADYHIDPEAKHEQLESWSEDIFNWLDSLDHPVPVRQK